MAVEYARHGAQLILSARRESALETVRQACVKAGADPDTVWVLPLDVTDEASLPAVVRTARGLAGRLDMLINNAGVSQSSSLLQTEMATYRQLFEVDVFGQFALTKLVVPIMIKQGSGHIAVTASVAGKIGAPFRTGYCAAKHAVMGFFDALRTEVAHRNIQVSTITPGYIRTNISENALSGDGTPFGKLDSNIANGMAADECARIVVRGLEQGKREIPVGKGMEMKALWIKRFFPNLLFNMMNKQYARMAKSNKIEN